MTSEADSEMTRLTAVLSMRFEADRGCVVVRVAVVSTPPLLCPSASVSSVRVGGGVIHRWESHSLSAHRLLFVTGHEMASKKSFGSHNDTLLSFSYTYTVNVARFQFIELRHECFCCRASSPLPVFARSFTCQRHE